jgi:hypothetical protein
VCVDATTTITESMYRMYNFILKLLRNKCIVTTTFQGLLYMGSSGAYSSEYITDAHIKNFRGIPVSSHEHYHNSQNERML